jgi:hypothetical protein
LYQKVGAEEREAIFCDWLFWVYHGRVMVSQMTRLAAATISQLTKLELSRQSKADLDTATVLLVLLALQEHHRSPFRKRYETLRSSMLSGFQWMLPPPIYTLWMPTVRLMPRLFSITLTLPKCCRGKINKVWD